MSRHTLGPLVPRSILPNSKLLTPKPDAYITSGSHDAPGNRVVAAVYSVDGSSAVANAERLAHCWNCHDDLVEALEGMMKDHAGYQEWQAAKSALAKAQTIPSGEKGERQ